MLLTLEKKKWNTDLIIHSATEILENWDDEHGNSYNAEELGVGVFLHDEKATKKLSSLLEQFGYKTFAITSLEQLKESVSSKKLDLIIMSMEFDEGKGTSLLKSVQQGNNEIPVIFISDNNTVENQLEAVNNGGIAFLSEQLEFTAILDVLDQVVSRSTELPYRVLIVDDEAMIADYYSIILGAANIQTCEIANPNKIMEAITDFDPDLILLDLHMPECSGLDLAKVIRQHLEYSSIPIVFLSMEEDEEQQLSAINLGADDFLKKGIDAMHLVTSITARIKRARKLRSLMVKDSLSGLYNHSSIKQHLINESKRAMRNGSNFCYAMLDIDNFKSINDTYGHATGDRVIRQLSHLLRHRLRTTDIVGRYGGEEFSIIMPDTSIDDALDVLNEVRHIFSEFKFYVDDEFFQCSFSGGISDYKSNKDSTKIHDAADKMLYKSKRSGKNRLSITVSETAM